MDLTSIPDDIMAAWLRTQTDLTQNNLEGFVMLAQLSDTDKIASLTTYLGNRISDNTSRASTLEASIQSQIDALDADSVVCTALLGS